MSTNCMPSNDPAGQWIAAHQQLDCGVAPDLPNIFLPRAPGDLVGRQMVACLLWRMMVHTSVKRLAEAEQGVFLSRPWQKLEFTDGRYLSIGRAQPRKLGVRNA
jgi:hypothetical protein